MNRTKVLWFCPVLMAAASFGSAALGSTSEESSVGKPLPERDWGPEKNGCRIALETENRKFFRGYKRIIITVYIGNSGKTTLSIPEADKYSDNNFIVKDKKDEVMPLTAFGKKATLPAPAAGTKIRRLEPREEFSYTFLLNRVYDMTVASTYSITLKRRILKLGEDGKPIKVDGRYQDEFVSSTTIKVKVK